jgi:hypothetical protein
MKVSTLSGCSLRFENTIFLFETYFKFDGLEQTEAVEKMNTSQSTFQ